MHGLKVHHNKDLVQPQKTLMFMGLFSFTKSSLPKQTEHHSSGPYKNSAANLIYQLLFCDNMELFKVNTVKPYTYPFSIIFSEESTIADLQKIIDDYNTDPRLRILAYRKQNAMGQKQCNKELLAVIVEVGLDEGLDVLASFNNGTARYINQAEKILIWETTDETSNKLTQELFSNSGQVVNRIGPWDEPRKPHPQKGNARISFLVSGDLYFGEAPMNDLFNDPIAGPALSSATALLRYITEKSAATSSTTNNFL